MNLCKAAPIYMLMCMIGGAVIGWFTSAPLHLSMMIGLGAALLPFLLLALAYFFIVTFLPERPPCRCGRSKSGDYDFVEMKEIAAEADGTVKHEFTYQCPSCSRTFIARGDNFFEYLEGERLPFMIKNPRGRWIPAH